ESSRIRLHELHDVAESEPEDVLPLLEQEREGIWATDGGREGSLGLAKKDWATQEVIGPVNGLLVNGREDWVTQLRWNPCRWRKGRKSAGLAKENLGHKRILSRLKQTGPAVPLWV
ncbi:hypothetical protein Droror1_Dr00016428, partial [Drosera rotundifolia]